MKKVIVDTNPILRFFLNDLPIQKKAFEKLLYQAKDSKVSLIIPQIVVFELNFILDKYYNFSKEDVIDRLKVLVSTDYIEVESREVFVDAFSLYKTSHNSFVDCFLQCLAQAEKADIFTFDKKLLR